MLISKPDSFVLLPESWLDLPRFRRGDHLVVAQQDVSPALLEAYLQLAKPVLETQSALAIAPERFCEGGLWKIHALTNSHLPPALAINSSMADEELHRTLSANSWEQLLLQLPALTLDVGEIFHLVLHHTNHFTNPGLLATDLCNLSCDMCMFHSQDHGETYHFALKRRKDRQRQHLRSDLLYSYLSQMPSGTPVLFSAAGEFLVLPNAVQQLAAASEMGLKPQLATNGMLLSKETSQRLIDAGLADIIISVDGYDQPSYAAKRKGGDYYKLLANIENLLELREKAGTVFSVTINSVFFEDIELNQQMVIDFWRQNGVDQLAFLAERLDYLGRPRSLFIKDEVTPYCFELLTGPILLTNGLIAPCCSVAIAEWFERFTWLVNISNISLCDAYAHYKDMLLDQNSPFQRFCKRCQYWRNSYSIDGLYPFAKIYRFDGANKQARKTKRINSSLMDLMRSPRRLIDIALHHKSTS